MAAPNLGEVSQSQRARLFHIDFRGLFLGVVSRGHLMHRFGIGQAAATRDLALYRALAPHNLVFDTAKKTYRSADPFIPLFRHDPEASLRAIAEGLGDDAVGGVGPHVRTERPARLNAPRLEVIACVTRAIAEERALAARYFSLSSGLSECIVCPFALVDSGFRWHARAFDRMRGGFCNVALTRISEARLLLDGPEYGERREADDQWMRFVPLELVPHPALARREAVMAEYGMEEGVLRVRIRAALAAQALTLWSVDTTADHRLDPMRHQLWLPDRAALWGVENLELLPE